MNNILSRYIAENINGDTNLSENDMINYNIKKFNETIEQSKKSDFYSKKLKDIKNIKYLKAIENIPFTSEDEIRENYKKMLVRMEQDDWLTNYRENQGIQFSMQNVLNTATYLEKNIPVFEVFLNHKEQLQFYFDAFYPDLLSECELIFKPK